HTLVSDEMRSIMVQTAREQNVETIDLMGPLLMRLSNQFANAPSEKPGLFHELNRDYFRRIEAMEFSFRHDDGLRSHELDKADIILVGVSRTFKTPLSIYLSIKGWLVANVPVILGMEPPDMLFEVAPEKVFGLTTYPSRLSLLRKYRHDHLGGATGDYASYAYVSRELAYAQEIFKRQPGWAVINVTSKSIEEIASEILALMRKTAPADTDHHSMS
ncbi:MAG: kinase/pyrophosphorylase, partial [Bacteroidales bacterium]|nr:kinase/pyrophosphorylase [Bacteroidales bacterium]